MSKNLVSLTDGASCYVFMDEFSHAWPPVVFLEISECFGHSWMSCSGPVVVNLQYRLGHAFWIYHYQGFLLPEVPCSFLQVVFVLPPLQKLLVDGHLLL